MQSLLRCLVALATLCPGAVLAFDGPELYPGERALYASAQTDGMVVSFDTGPTWANWKSEFAQFKERYPDIEIVYNDIGSAVTVTTLEKSRNRPQADTAYYFAGSALDAAAKDLVAPFRPVNVDKLPESLRDADGRWFAVHTLSVAFLVNTKLVKTVPKSWADLLKPEYRNSIVYLDPRSTGQGQMVVLAANVAAGGGMTSAKPGLDYLARLHKSGNVLRTLGTTPYAQFLKGEIPIWIGYENDGLKAKYVDGMGEGIAVVIPEEGSASAPYAVSLVKGAPHPNAARLWLNFIMTEQGQKIFAEGFVRPAVDGIALPATVADKMPPAPRLVPVDVAKAQAMKADIDSQWARGALDRTP
jgi:putative spermidine/putrescine transport system substrate-binding protein